MAFIFINDVPTFNYEKIFKKMCKNIFTEQSQTKYIGVDDLKLDLFEGMYPLPHGISYNSYLIDDEKIAVIDSVDAQFANEWLAKLDQALAGRTPHYIIVQHAEPDHSGSLGVFLMRYPDAQVVATVAALKFLANFLPDIDLKPRSIAVRDGQTLSLGNHQLRFITAPLVHWPEVMMTFDDTTGILYTADAFGTFSCAGTMDGWPDEARRYYANIVGRFGTNVEAVLQKLRPLDVKAIAPLHGPVLTDHISQYFELYRRWSSYTPETEDDVLIAYASVYGGTARVAQRLADMLRERGVGVSLIDLCRTHLSHAVAEAFRVRNIALCSVTLDGDLYPPMHHFLHHLILKKLSGRRFALIENGTWAPVAAARMTEMLAKLPDSTIVQPTLTIRSRLTDADLPTLEAIATALTSR